MLKIVNSFTIAIVSQRYIIAYIAVLNRAFKLKTKKKHLTIKTQMMQFEWVGQKLLQNVTKWIQNNLK